MGARCTERDGQTTSVRKQFTNEITRGKKFEGVYGTDKGVYVVNSFAFNTADLPADAVKHDGMVWFYSYADQTITLVTYFPHQTTTEHRCAAPRYDGVVFDGPDNVTVTPWGTLVLAEDGVGASHVLSSVPGGPTYAIARNQLNIGTAGSAGVLRVHRADVLLRRQGAVRQHPDAGHHAGDHRPLVEVPRLSYPRRAAPAISRRAGRGALRPGRRGPGRDRRQVVVVELEAEDVEVLRDPRRRHGLRDHDRAELHVPAQDHLGRRAAVLVGEPREHRVGSSSPPLAIGLHASVAMPELVVGTRAARAAGGSGCSSTWLTVGTTSALVDAAARRWSGSKFDTPIARTRPSR